MKFNLPIICGVVFASVLPAFGQVSVMRAVVRGGYSDRGKCTIEVDIDDVAEVEVIGDEARLITLSGGPAQWRRFQCSGVMPRHPREFRFSGIDGRGRQTLIADPRETGGVAVVRLEDRKGGREGYTFDLEWRGVEYGRGDREDWNRRRDYDDYPRYPNRDYDNSTYDRYDSRRGAAVVSCGSDGSLRYCNADVRGGVQIVRQRSRAACVLGESWGYDERGIWTDRGCRGDFALGR